MWIRPIIATLSILLFCGLYSWVVLDSMNQTELFTCDQTIEYVMHFNIKKLCIFTIYLLVNNVMIRQAESRLEFEIWITGLLVVAINLVLNILYYSYIYLIPLPAHIILIDGLTILFLLFVYIKGVQNGLFDE